MLAPSDTKAEPLSGLTRRQLLARTSAAGALAMIGAGFVAAPDAAWAATVETLSPHQMATLLQMARDIYPHDNIADRYYMIAVKGYDSPEHQTMIASGVADLDRRAWTLNAPDYLSVPWEEQRTALLQQIETSAFFQTLRGGLITGLYNQQAVWPIFGYEGESFSKGGYIDRGFDDIDWL